MIEDTWWWQFVILSMTRHESSCLGRHTHPNWSRQSLARCSRRQSGTWRAFQYKPRLLVKNHFQLHLSFQIWTNSFEQLLIWVPIEILFWIIWCTKSYRREAWPSSKFVFQLRLASKIRRQTHHVCWPRWSLCQCRTRASQLSGRRGWGAVGPKCQDQSPLSWWRLDHRAQEPTYCFPAISNPCFPSWVVVTGSVWCLT